MSPSRPSSRQFEISLDLAARRAEVWKAIATSEGLSSWFAPNSSIEPEPGGAVLWDWAGACGWPLVVDELQDQSRLLLRYDSNVDDGEGGKVPLYIEFLLEGEGDSTVLRLVHSGFGEDSAFDEEYDGISGGWPQELNSLKQYVEKHAGKTRRPSWARVNVDMTPKEAVVRLLGEDGLALSPALGSLHAGDTCRFQLGNGLALEGEVAVEPIQSGIAARLSDLGDAYMITHAWTGHGQPGTQVWIWIAHWDADDALVARYQEAAEETLARVFPTAAPVPIA